MSHGTDAAVESPGWGRAFDPSVSGGRCTGPECDPWRVAETSSGGRRLVTDGGPTEDARAENGDDGDEVDDGLHPVDLGQNATVVNAEGPEQGDRVPVEPGDRIDRSGVARIGGRQD